MQGMDWVQTMGQSPSAMLRLAGKGSSLCEYVTTPQCNHMQGDFGRPLCQWCDILSKRSMAAMPGSICTAAT